MVAIASEPLEVQLRRRAFARLLKSRSQLNAGVLRTTSCYEDQRYLASEAPNAAARNDGATREMAHRSREALRMPAYPSRSPLPNPCQADADAAATAGRRLRWELRARPLVT
jgi:hypothetical protein